MNKLIGYKGTFDDFFELFLSDKVPYSPIYRHYNEITNLAGNEIGRGGRNILIINYEKLKTDFRSEINKICDFLGKERLSSDEIVRLEEHCSFEQMSRNPAVNYQHWDELGLRDTTEAAFMRKGITGDWQSYFSPSQQKRFQAWSSTSSSADQQKSQLVASSAL